MPAELVDAVVEAIATTARTGKIGDGKVFVMDLERALRIRTGEFDGDADPYAGIGVDAIDAPEARELAREAVASSVVVLKRSMASGFAGIDNPLFYDEKTSMLFGDAKSSVAEITAEVQAL